MLTYAGAPLLVAPPDVAARVAEGIDPSWLCEFMPRTWPGPSSFVQALGWRGPTQLPLFGPSVEIGVLRWPMWGASRFAVGHFLCGEESAQTIRRVAYSTGSSRGSWAAAKLVMDDGRGGIEPDLYCLPLRPLEQVATGVPGLYLLTLVDERYLWWWRTSSALSIVEDSTTWADCYVQIRDALGISADLFEADDPAGEYFSGPPVSLAVKEGPLPAILDATAASLQQRVVYHYDGYVHVMNASESLTVHRRNIAREGASSQSASEGFPNGRLAGNHFLVPGDWPAALPRSVKLVSVKTVDGSTQESEDAITRGVHTVEVTLASTSVGASYAPSVTGFSGSKVFYTSAVANYADSESESPVNDSEMSGLAARLAEDWYTWQLGRAEAAYEGCVGWAPEGHVDEAHFEYTYGRVATRITRGPWKDHLEDLHHWSSFSVDDTLSALVVTNVCPEFTEIEDGGLPPDGDYVDVVVTDDGETWTIPKLIDAAVSGWMGW
jgi:hypothetical protein